MLRTPHACLPGGQTHRQRELPKARDEAHPSPSPPPVTSDTRRTQIAAGPGERLNDQQ